MACTLTDDEHDLSMLSQGSERGIFTVALTPGASSCYVECYERGLNNGWYYLYDIAALPDALNGGFYLARVLKLTPKGIRRRDELRLSIGPTANTQPV